MRTLSFLALIGIGLFSAMFGPARGEDPAPVTKATIDGSGSSWRPLGEKDFVHVNCDPDTFTWNGGTVHCTGKPVGVIRSQKPYGNFELVAQWRHLSSGGNSGIFVWARKKQ